MARVDFEVTSSANAYWLAVDELDVPIANDKGSIELPAGRNTLIWWFVGDEGETIGIVGKRGDATVVEVKASAIPKSQTKGAGVRRFTL